MGAALPAGTRPHGRHLAPRQDSPRNVIDLPAIRRKTRVLLPAHIRRKIIQVVLSVVVMVTGLGFIMVTAPNLFPQVTLDVPKQYSAADMVTVGGPAADFTLPRLNGSDVRLGAYRGQLVVLTFWAGWSPLAVEQLHTLERLKDKAGDSAISILAVNSLEDKSAVSSLARRSGLSLPILLDEEGKVTEEYGVTTLPVTFFIDGDGRVLERMVGPMSIGQMENRIKLLSSSDRERGG